MTAAVAVVNLVLGVAYCGYGVMTAVEMKRDWRSFGFSHFGAAWIFMAFTCGPHHLFHGIHLAFEGRAGGSLDLLAVVVGLPVGVAWLFLRVEAFFGGRGDRFIPGTPRWMRTTPSVAVAYVLTLIVAGASTLAAAPASAAARERADHAVEVAASGGATLHVGPMVVANASLVVIYMAIGWFVLRTQLSNRGSMAGWSVSGLCLSVIFPTCALMHGVWGLYNAVGRYGHDVHGNVIDWLSVPAALYFLWVVRSLYRDSLRDWNQGPDEVGPELVPA